MALQFVSSELRSDFDVVLAAVQNNGQAIMFAHPSLHDNPEIMLASVKTFGDALSLAPTVVQSNKDIVLAAVSNSGDSLRYASAELTDDYEIVKTAVSNQGYALRYASSNQRGDRRIILAAVQRDGNLLRFASTELQNDREVVTEAIRQEPLALRFASSTLRSESNVVLAAVSRNAMCFKFATGALRGDFDLLQTAINNQNPDSKVAVDDDDDMNDSNCDVLPECPLLYASAELRGRPDAVLMQIAKTPEALILAAPALRSDLNFMTMAVELLVDVCDPSAFQSFWELDYFAVLKERIAVLGLLVVDEHKMNPNTSPLKLSQQWQIDLALKESHLQAGTVFSEDISRIIRGFTQWSIHHQVACDLGACSRLLNALAAHYEIDWWSFLVRTIGDRTEE